MSGMCLFHWGARRQWLVPLAETGKEVAAKTEQAIERKIKKRLC